MKKIIALSLALALGLVATVSAQTVEQPKPVAKDTSAAAPASKAKIYVDAMEFNFGFMPSGNYVSHAFWLQSRGMDSLKILNVRPG